LKLTGFNDAIVIVVGDPERRHLPWWVNFELQLVWQKKSESKTACIYTVKESRVFFCPLFYGVPVQSLQDFSSCSGTP
jgi:hypothetical protein